MPDPQRDIAPIIEPVAPAAAQAGPDYTLPVALGFIVLLGVVVLIWRWRRRAPLRKLRKLAHASDPVKAANALAALVNRYPLALPPDWQNELERLRFGPPAENDADLLARLCLRAEIFLRQH